MITIQVLLTIKMLFNKLLQYVLLKTPNIYYIKSAWVRDSEAACLDESGSRTLIWLQSSESLMSQKF